MGIVYDKMLEYRKKHPGGIVWRMKKHADVVEKYLNKDEKVLYAFPAQKNESFAEIFCTFAVVLTNKRILLGHKRIVWGSFYYTITPDLYNDMQIYNGLIWGKVQIDTVKELIVLTNIDRGGLDDIETAITEFMMEAKKEYKIEHEKV